MKKKSQGQIISSILIILFILGLIIIIIWFVAEFYIKKSSKEVSDLSDCFGITLAFEKAVVGVVDNVIIRRGTGGPYFIGIYILPEHENVIYGYGNIHELEFEKFDVDSLYNNQEIKAGAILNKGILCPPIASSKVIN